MIPLDRNGTQFQGQTPKYIQVLRIRQHTSAHVNISQCRPLDNDGRHFQDESLETGTDPSTFRRRTMAFFVLVCLFSKERRVQGCLL